jgi:predicted HTH transcriptional regulator
MPNTKQSFDYENIISSAAKELEAFFDEIQQELTPLRQEEARVAEAIRRIVGSYPAGYDVPTGGRKSRADASKRPSPEERQAQVLEVITKNPGTTNTLIATELEVSKATVAKPVDALLADGRVKPEGEHAQRKLYPA